MNTNMQPPALPAEYTSMLTDCIADTLAEWLKANNAPEEVITLVNNLDFLHAYTAEAKTGEVAEHDNREVVLTLPGLINALTVLGCAWSGPSGTALNVREPVIWQGAESVEALS